MMNKNATALTIKYPSTIVKNNGKETHKHYAVFLQKCYKYVKYMCIL